MASSKPVYAEDKGTDPIKTDPAGVPHNYTSDEDFKVETATTQYSNLSFWTRMGCTPESFKRRNAVDKQNQLNQTLRSRHLHMIAIGESHNEISEAITDSSKVAPLVLVSSSAQAPLCALVARHLYLSTTVSLAS